jgi:hypothetical protein
VADLGGRRRAAGHHGHLNGSPFTEHDACGGRRPCVGVSKAALKAAGAGVGDEVQLSIQAATS